MLRRVRLILCPGLGKRTHSDLGSTAIRVEWSGASSASDGSRNLYPIRICPDSARTISTRQHTLAWRQPRRKVALPAFASVGSSSSRGSRDIPIPLSSMMKAMSRLDDGNYPSTKPVVGSSKNVSSVTTILTCPGSSPRIDARVLLIRLPRMPAKAPESRQGRY